MSLGDNGTSPGEGVSVAHHVAHCKRVLNVTERAKARIGDVPTPVCGALFPAASGSEPNNASSGWSGDAPHHEAWTVLRWTVRDLEARTEGRSLLFGSTAGAAALTPAEFEDLKSSHVRAPAPLHQH